MRPCQLGRFGAGLGRPVRSGPWYFFFQEFLFIISPDLQTLIIHRKNKYKSFLCDSNFYEYLRSLPFRWHESLLCRINVYQMVIVVVN
jgi:hypothetical protein